MTSLLTKAGGWPALTAPSAGSGVARVIDACANFSLALESEYFSTTFVQPGAGRQSGSFGHCQHQT
jgi:hypothetical protein